METKRTLKHLTEQFLNYLRIEKDISTATIDAYSRDLSKLGYFLNGRSPLDATRDDLRGFLVCLKDVDELSDRSIDRVFACLHSFYNYLTMDGFRGDNPSSGLRTRSAAVTIPRFLNRDEIQRLLNAALTPRDRAMLELLYAAGLRASELVSLEMDKVTERMVTVTGKGRKTRSIPIYPEAFNAVLNYLEVALPCGGRLFNVSRYDVWRAVKKAAEGAGLENVYPHSIRHSFATHIAQQGCDLKVLSDMMGHETVDTTQIYMHITSDELKAKYEKFHPRR